MKEKFLRFIKNKWVRLCILLTLFVVYSVAATLLLGTACPINLVTGLPCFSCGITRANLLALSLRFREAFSMHPLFFYSYIAAALLILVTAKPRIIGRRWFTGLCIALAAIFLAVYVVRMILYFPSAEPLVYNSRSLLGYIIGLFRK